MKDFITEEIGPRRSAAGPANRWKTSPLTNPFQESPKTTLLFAAQSRAFSNKQQCTQNQPSTSMRTPILSRTNPFVDVSNLEFDKCSPGLFISRPSSSEKTEFRWSIEDISRITPAQIDSPNSVPEEYFDEETENAAQDAINKYFSIHHSVVSPPDTYEQMLPSAELSTPPEYNLARAALRCCRSSSVIGYSSSGKGMTTAISSTPCTRTAAERRKNVIKIDESSQTKLSFPPILPPEVEAVLQPYMQNKDDNCEAEECNVSNSTLRRKLFFNKEDTLSPLKAEEISGNLTSSPILNNSSRPSRITWTPDKQSEQEELYCFSSPDVSPIKFKSNFDFTKEMSIDCSAILCNNMIDTGVTDPPSTPSKIVSSNKHDRQIFSSTVQQASHIDPTDKDTGYSTMDVDTTQSTQAQVTNKS